MERLKGRHVRAVRGYEGRYAVTDTGEVLTSYSGFWCELTKVGGGRYVNLYGRGGSEKVLVSYLVARAFLPNPQRRPFVVHADGDASNNALSNLSWSEVRDGSVSPLRRAVLQCDRETGEVLREFASVSDAASAVGVTRASVQSCIAGRTHTCAGYIWLKK